MKQTSQLLAQVWSGHYVLCMHEQKEDLMYPFTERRDRPAIRQILLLEKSINSSSFRKRLDGIKRGQALLRTLRKLPSRCIRGIHARYVNGQLTDQDLWQLLDEAIYSVSRVEL